MFSFVLPTTPKSKYLANTVISVSEAVCRDWILVRKLYKIWKLIFRFRKKCFINVTKRSVSICAWTSQQFFLLTPARNNSTLKYNKLFPLVCILFYDPINSKLSRPHSERTPSCWHVSNIINRLPKDEQWNPLMQPIFKSYLLQHACHKCFSFQTLPFYLK